MLTLTLTLASDTGLSVSSTRIPAPNLNSETLADALEELQTLMAIAYAEQEKALERSRTIYNPPYQAA